MSATDENASPPTHRKHKAFVDSKLSPEVKFDIPPIQQCFVQKELLSLDPKIAAGTDGVSSKILKVPAPSITLVVTKNYQS